MMARPFLPLPKNWAKIEIGGCGGGSTERAMPVPYERNAFYRVGRGLAPAAGFDVN